MSKLANSIMAKDTNVRRAILSPRACMITEELNPIPSMHTPDAVEYRIGMKLEHRVCIADRQALRLAVDASKRSIIHEVFGEFIPYFHQIEGALWDHDVDEAKKVLRAFHEQMFSVDDEAAMRRRG